MGNDDSKKLILARRARFVAAALASVAATTPLIVGAEACGGETEEQSPQPCLSVDAEPPKDVTPQPCLSVDAEPPKDATPQPCLDIEPPKDAAGADADPQPCLFAPMDDGD